MDTEEKTLLLTQVQTDVSMLSFLAVISIFFIGALLPQFNSYNISVKIPVSFLIISTFAFIFSALILANSSQQINKGSRETTQKYLTYAYAIAEYLGVFLFVLSIPLTVNVITGDFYLRTVAFCAAIVGIGFYQLMGFSLLQNHFTKSHTAFSLVVIVSGIILFAAQIYAFHFTLISAIVIGIILLITCMAPVKKVQ